MTKFAATNVRSANGPVRRIGVQSRSITGTMPDGNRYESSLERDFMLLLQFDPKVDVYTPQPLTVRYRGIDGAMHRYTPDGLIEWRTGMEIGSVRPMLVEIKYREAFKGDWRRWRCLTRALVNFAESRGWDFAIFTERKIRTPALDNARFLQPYKRRLSTPETEEWILNLLEELIESTPATLVALLHRDKWNQALILPVVWKLLAERRIGFSLEEPLSMETSIWSTRR